MKLSQTEHNIKKQLAQREIQPSAKLWDNIQGELDKENKSSNNKGLWIKLSAIAAVLCLCFLAYQGFQKTDSITPEIVLDQKGIKTQPVNFDPLKIDIIVSPVYEVKTATTMTNNENTKSIPSTKGELVKNAITEQNTSQKKSEAELLLQEVSQDMAKAEQEKQLVAEVENLLDQAIENTQDIQQKEILKTMQARLLLAEVEAEVELIKPPNLKDKIWDAIVDNYTDLKNSVVLN